MQPTHPYSFLCPLAVACLAAALCLLAAGGPSRASENGPVAGSHERRPEGPKAEREVAVEAHPSRPSLRALRKPPRKIAEVVEGFLWIDAEDFADYGGWSLDTQFVHRMGSAYLIAAGVGTPVDDATVDVEVPGDGTYRLWVRAKNWLASHSPGRFQVVVGGTVAKPIFGTADTEAWTWLPAGDFDLEAGPTRIALRDLTGYYGRCDALVLTSDLRYVPPDDAEAIKIERSRLTGLSLEPKPGGEFDVIVVGAGAAGNCAALAAARMGAATALIQDRPVLGGNASVELGVPINGAASRHPNARESGIIEELGRVKARFGHPKMSEAFRLAAEAEPNLSVFLNQHVFAVEMKNDRLIEAVQAVDTLTGEITVYRAGQFIDCTGDGWVGFFAGAAYRLGREARDEFGESLAPEQSDNITMSGCLMGQLTLCYRAENVGKPVAYTPPPWAAKLPPADQFGRNPRAFAGGQWWLEHPGDIDDLYDAERARDELIRITFGYWDYIKNHWPERDRAAQYALTYVPITNAKRESRRLVGDSILTQNDVENAAVFPDRIAYGGWPLDVHHPKGIYSGKEGPFDCNPHVPIYTIPFRCLYSANVDNLLFAGRNVSVTHVALGSVRVQGTLATLGQAAGTAAALCLERGATPRGLYEKHMRDFQQILLKNDQYIPGVVNEDPNDLARRATITASSTARCERFDRLRVDKGEGHPLNMDRAVLFPRGTDDLAAVSLLLSSQLEKPVEVTLHLREASSSGDFSASDDALESTAVVPPGKPSLVEFAVGRKIAGPYVWLWLPKTEGVFWHLMETAPLGACRAYGNARQGRWTVVEGQYYAVLARPPLAIEADFRPENVANGVARIVGKESNLWVSDAAEPFPQWIELAWDAPVRMTSVALTFDTDMNMPFHTLALVPQCVRDYDLSYHDGTKWSPLARQRGNFQRRRVHAFAPVDATKLRLTVLSTNGAPSARVFEIRVYGAERLPTAR